MSDGSTIAGVLLVAGPALGMFGFYDPGLYRVWGMPREEFLATVGAHRCGWTAINAGFTIATVLTAAGLVILAGALDVAQGPRAVLIAVAIAYALAGALWCAVLAIRNRTTPALAAMVAAGASTEPAETLLDGVTGGLFAAFSLTTGFALIGLGLTLAVAGGVAAPVAGFAVLIGAVAVATFAVSGDLIPAVLYFPTLVIGIALLVRWS
jgi:hypothetical protein